MEDQPHNGTNIAGPATAEDEMPGEAQAPAMVQIPGHMAIYRFVRFPVPNKEMEVREMQAPPGFRLAFAPSLQTMKAMVPGSVTRDWALLVFERVLGPGEIQAMIDANNAAAEADKPAE